VKVKVKVGYWTSNMQGIPQSISKTPFGVFSGASLVVTLITSCKDVVRDKVGAKVPTYLNPLKNFV
jgi:hypothetical protein